MMQCSFICGGVGLDIGVLPSALRHTFAVLGIPKSIGRMEYGFGRNEDMKPNQRTATSPAMRAQLENGINAAGSLTRLRSARSRNLSLW
jgi:hypothetical protein